MQVPKLKTLVEVGAVQQLSAVYDPALARWTLVVTYHANPDRRTETLERQRGGPRPFATLEALTRFLAGLGIHEFSVSASGFSDKWVRE